MARLTTRREHSAGGIVVRDVSGGREVALIRVGDPGRWQLPKGMVDRGETAEQAAVRETREETGITGTLVAPLGDIAYWYVRHDEGAQARVHKKVSFFLLRYASGDVRDHDHEVTEAAWAPLGEAESRLAFEGERKMLRRAIEALDEAL